MDQVIAASSSESAHQDARRPGDRAVKLSAGSASSLSQVFADRPQRYPARFIFGDSFARIAIGGCECLLHDVSSTGIGAVLPENGLADFAVGDRISLTMNLPNSPPYKGVGRVARLDPFGARRKIGIRLVGAIDPSNLVLSRPRAIADGKAEEAARRLEEALDEALAAPRVAGLVAAAHRALHDARQTLGRTAWDRLRRDIRRHPIGQLFYQDPLTRRCYEKPRGYAGDADLLDLIYGAQEAAALVEDATPIGRLLCGLHAATTAAQGVRHRRDIIAAKIDEIARDRPGAAILSVACGHLREADRAVAVAGGGIGRYVILDHDRDSIANVLDRGLRVPVEPIVASVHALATGKVAIAGSFDLVYSTGLFDYLPDPVAVRLIRYLWAAVRAGGRLLIANATPDNPQLGFLESFMDWMFVLRGEGELCGLAARALGAAQPVRSFRDATGVVVFCDIVKAPQA
jgi:extracellular factor (EF) 3-hydroxypalmitic acid methyl ester biosynthesis protein